jgi:DNA-binding transcriptional regulator YhcF (GntR family)
MSREQERALEHWLEEHCAQQPPGSPIASQRELAARWGLSREAVSRVTRGLIDKKKLASSPGKSVVVARGGATPVGSAQTLVALLSALIREGTLKQGELLPSNKYMSIQYRVAPATVVAAYRLLCQKGLVFKIGKRFCVGKPRQVVGAMVKKTVMVYCFTPQGLGALFNSPLMGAAYRKMERELIKYGWSMVYGNPEQFAELLTKGEKGWAGIDAIFCADMSQQDYEQHLGRLKRLVGPRRLPGAPAMVIAGSVGSDILGGITYFNHGNIQTTIFRTLAQRLYHKHLGVVRLFYRFDWHMHSLAACAKLYSELRALDPRCCIEYFCVVTPQQRAALVAYVNDIGSRMAPGAGFERAVRYIGTLQEGFTLPGAPAAWICTDDADAVAVLDWATAAGVELPRDIALVGLENAPAFLGRGISSCVHDWETTGYLMAHALIGDIELQVSTRGFVRTQALMLERASS